jgi:hypothetical protein
MADGALFDDVVRVLRDAGVSVESTDKAPYFRVSRGDIVKVICLRGVVSRTVVDLLHRTFDLPKARFFPTTLRAVPLERQKASGQSE